MIAGRVKKVHDHIGSGLQIASSRRDQSTRCSRGTPRARPLSFQVDTIVTVSLGATILANVMFLFDDAAWFKSLAKAIAAAIAFVVTLPTLQVFPFNFSTYDHDWSGLVRLLIVVAMIGCAIGCVAEMIRLLTMPLRRQPGDV